MRKWKAPLGGVGIYFGFVGCLGLMGAMIDWGWIEPWMALIGSIGLFFWIMTWE